MGTFQKIMYIILYIIIVESSVANEEITGYNIIVHVYTCVKLGRRCGHAFYLITGTAGALNFLRLNQSR